MSSHIINGLKFKSIKSKKISGSFVGLCGAPKMPLVSIEQVGNTSSYDVTIMAYIPAANLLSKITKPDNSFYLPIPQDESDELVCFVYDCDETVKITTTKELTCRWFRVDCKFERIGDEEIDYDQYQITFTYELLVNTGSVDAIKARVKNLNDPTTYPELPRGTITTVRFD